MELKILFQNTSYLVATRIVKFALGFIRTKIIAIFLGVTGMGIIAQLTLMTEALARFTVSDMNDGLVKLIAESDKDDKGFKEKFVVSIKSYIFIITISVLFVISISFYFSENLTIYFLGDINYYGYFLIALASFPLLNMNGVSFAILKSFKQIKYIAKAQILEIIINLIIFIPMVYFWGLTGAVIYITFAYLTILIVTHHYTRSIVFDKLNISFINIFKAKTDRKVFRKLFVFVGYGLTAGVATIIADTVTRGIVVTQLGISQIGIYSPVIIWTSLFAGLIMPSISTYLYPRYCECKSNGELNSIINDSLRFVTLLMIPFTLLSIPIRYQIISLFFSQDFKSAGDYLPWHLLGTLFYMWMYIFDLAMKPTGRIKTGGIIILIMCAIDFTIVFLLAPSIGLYGYMLKFIISPIIFFIYYILYWRHENYFKIQNKNISLMGYLVLSIFIILGTEKYLNANYITSFIEGSCLIGLSSLMLEKSEKYFIIQKLNIIIKLKNIGIN